MPRSIRLGLALTALLVSLPALAERPSLGSVNAELHRNRDAMCAKADADGDSYRPFVCDARCDCISAATLSKLETCDETSPGTVTATGVETAPGPSCEEQSLPGQCVPIPQLPGFGLCGTYDGQPAYSGQACNPASPSCPAGETCFDAPAAGLGGSPICVRGCTSPADCPSTSLGSLCVVPGCSGPADCPTGYGCLDGFCVKPCSADADCDLVSITAVTLQGVAPEDSPQAVLCDGQPINSNDALRCIDQIEQVTGPCQ